MARTPTKIGEIMPIIVAMDGPSGAGKSSTSKAIAKRAGWNYLDTGALYRGATWLAMQKNISDANELVAVAKLSRPAVKTFDSELLIKIRLDF